MQIAVIFVRPGTNIFKEFDTLLTLSGDEAMNVCFAFHFYLAQIKLSQRHYRGENKGLFVLLSRTLAGPGRTVKQEQEYISRNHVQTVQTFIFPSVFAHIVVGFFF